MSKVLKKEQVAANLDLKSQIDLAQKQTSHFVKSKDNQKVISQKDYSSTQEANQIIQKAQAQAQAIRQEAQAILNKVEDEKAKAIKQGQEVGRQKGYQEVTQLIAKTKKWRQQQFESAQKDMLNLVYSIVEKIIDHDFSKRKEAIVDLIRPAMEQAIGKNIVIRVHPDDYEKVKKQQTHLTQTIDATRTIQIRPDEKVELNGCLVETEIGTIDAQLSTQLKAIRHALELEEDNYQKQLSN